MLSMRIWPLLAAILSIGCTTAADDPIATTAPEADVEVRDGLSEAIDDAIPGPADMSDMPFIGAWVAQIDSARFELDLRPDATFELIIPGETAEGTYLATRERISLYPLEDMRGDVPTAEVTPRFLRYDAETEELTLELEDARFTFERAEVVDAP